jgi:uncharacterized lipoprotein YajG
MNQQGLKLIILLILSLAAVLSNGCALSKDYVTLSYDPQKDVSKVEGADGIEVKVKVLDMRTTGDKVSAKKNAYGMEMAPIIAKNDVADTVARAIESELANRGFGLAEGTVLVAVELSKFYNDFRIGLLSVSAVAEVIMNVQVKDASGNIVFMKGITGEGTNTGVQITSGKNAKEALDAALKDAVSRLVNDTSFIDSLLKAANGSRVSRKLGPLRFISREVAQLTLHSTGCSATLCIRRLNSDFMSSYKETS